MTADGSGGRTRVLSSSLDQVFSSTSNGLIMFAVAVSSSSTSFGDIALMMTALMAVIGAQRGALGTALLLSADQPQDRIEREGGFALTVSLIAGLIVAALLLVFGSSAGLPTLFVAAGAPVALAQDVLRYVAIAEGRAHVAAIWDGIWFAGSLALLVASWLTQMQDFVLLAGWVSLAVIALIGMLASLRLRPSVSGIRAWALAGWEHRVRYAIDAGLEQVTVFTVLAVAAAILGSAATAALRGATILLSPIGIFAVALQVIVISESTRRSSSPRVVWYSVLKLTGSVSCVTAVIGAALYLLPESLGRLLLGESFESARHLLPVITIEYISAMMIYSLAIYLKTFNRSSAVVWLKSGQSLTTIVLATVGAVAFGTPIGIAVGLAVGTFLAGAVGLAVFVPWRARTRGESVQIAGG